VHRSYGARGASARGARVRVRHAIPPPLPAPVAALAADLAEIPGAVAVVLGGSRATGTHRPDSDWDLGLYYRGSDGRFDPDRVARLGHPGYVSALGEWGPIVDGGAWLTVEGRPVDVLFRDLDRVLGWWREAEAGRFEVLAQNGALVGAPTYLPVGELAQGRPLHGEVPRPGFPEALAAAAPIRWRGRASVALLFAGTHARLGEAVACAGMLSAAVLCVGHARMAARRHWVLNEKRLVAVAGLEAAEPVLARLGGSPEALGRSVAALTALLEVDPPVVR
jgi:predicted nucleotidyltransferase